jgi:hypothetical protein
MRSWIVVGLFCSLSAGAVTLSPSAQISACKYKCEKDLKVCETRCERFPSTIAKVRCRAKCSSNRNACVFGCKHRQTRDRGISAGHSSMGR